MEWDVIPYHPVSSSVIGVVAFLFLTLPGILLTRTRYGVEKLVTCIKTNPHLNGKVFPQALLGQAAMTDVQQTHTLKNFRSGEYGCCFCNWKSSVEQ